jgi:hypothetical protein
VAESDCVIFQSCYGGTEDRDGEIDVMFRHTEKCDAYRCASRCKVSEKSWATGSMMTAEGLVYVQLCLDYCCTRL